MVQLLADDDPLYSVEHLKGEFPDFVKDKPNLDYEAICQW